ncbi:MAG: type VI secretion system contractile sheath small subunit [Cocleimonas sp.]|nr:type VI secretion system contractile sheath small subunit [Cocleimonas sp.]
MARSESKQKWVGRNRPPRVQIEYETEINGAQRVIDLPHITGVMSDLSGKSNVDKPEIRDRKFSEIDVDNFDDRMEAIEPRAAFAVDNVLSEKGGKLPVELIFKSMDDFSPDAIAKKVGGVKELLETRKELKNLLSYMDGKVNAEEWLGELLQDAQAGDEGKGLLKSLMNSPKPDAPDTNDAKEDKKDADKKDGE